MSIYRRERLQKIKDLPQELQKQLLWLYSYPVINGSVQNNAVERFVSGLMYLREIRELGAYVDFNQRGTTLNHEPVTCDKSEFKETLARFIQGSAAYAPEEKEKVIAFIASRGGQNFNYLIQELVMDDHFLPPGFKGKSSSNQTLFLENWKLDSTGKAVLERESDILNISAMCDEHDNTICLLIRDDEQGLRHFSMAEHPAIESVFDFEEIRKAGKVPPMMRIKYEVRLDIIDDRVVPVVTSLDVFNFAKALTTPDSALINQRDNLQSYLLKCRNKISTDMTAYNKESEEFQALETILRLIMQSNNGTNLTEIRFALQFIESLSMSVKVRSQSSLFRKEVVQKSLRVLLGNDSDFTRLYCNRTGEASYTPVSSLNDDQALAKRLLQLGIGMGNVLDGTDSDKLIHQLGSIYISLSRAMAIYEPVSVMNFNTTNGVISGQFVNAWQDRLKSAVRKKVDQNNESEIDILVNNFTMQSSYNKKERDAVIEWMKSKPMESMQSLLGFMFNHHIFKAVSDHVDDSFTFSCKSSKIAESRWFIDVSGKACLELTYDIDQISAAKERKQYDLIKKLGHSQLAVSAKPADIPIARVCTVISLDTREDDQGISVTPNIRSLQVKSYSTGFSLAHAALEYIADIKNAGPNPGNINAKRL